MAPMVTDAVKVLAVITTLLAVFTHQAVEGKTVYRDWEIRDKTITRNCQTVTVATVNGMFPGPTLDVNEGDRLIIKVTNKQQYPVTLHWHGIRQFRTNYADGPAHITQCPIQTGGSYIYDFVVDGQSGTFFYHAHITWLRATVHGALVVHPKKLPACYGRVAAEFPIIIGEWFGISPNVYELGFLNTAAPRENATTVTPTLNSQPGPKYGCSKGPQVYKVGRKKTYLLRIINAAMNNDYYFSVAKHKLTVVGADGNYLKPFVVTYLPLTPGQTTDVLVTMDQKPGKYYFGIKTGPLPNTPSQFPPPIPALAMFEYWGASGTASPATPTFPNNVTLAPLNTYNAKLRAYGTSVKKLPKKVNQDLIYTIGIALTPCIPPEPCGVKIVGQIQNITFIEPEHTSILEAYASGTNGVYTTGFPDNPPSLNFNLTGTDPKYLLSSRGTKVKMLNFGDHVRVVFQNVFAAGILDHPLHLHGHDFYVIGTGYGIYDPVNDPKKFNLVNPPAYNTFGVPNGGWLALQFHANNPGVWFVHCHFERHKSWGMSMAFITKNGRGKYQSLPGPNHPLPKCK